MKTIILVAGIDPAKALARVAYLHAERPEERTIVRSRVELQAALASGHVPIMNTLPAILEVRTSGLRRDFPDAEIVVVPVV